MPDRRSQLRSSAAPTIIASVQPMKFLAILAALALAITPLTGGASRASALHDQGAQMTGDGDCQPMPGHHDDKSTMVKCCVAVCAAAFMPAQGLAHKVAAPRLPAIPAADKKFHGYIGEVATPPPRA